jgi:hypothetical protein
MGRMPGFFRKVNGQNRACTRCRTRSTPISDSDTTVAITTRGNEPATSTILGAAAARVQVAGVLEQPRAAAHDERGRAGGQWLALPRPGEVSLAHLEVLSLESSRSTS